MNTQKTLSPCWKSASDVIQALTRVIPKNSSFISPNLFIDERREKTDVCSAYWIFFSKELLQTQFFQKKFNQHNQSIQSINSTKINTINFGNENLLNFRRCTVGQIYIYIYIYNVTNLLILIQIIVEKWNLCQSTWITACFNLVL